MFLFNCIVTLMNGLFQKENPFFKNKFIVTSTLWVGERMGLPNVSPPRCSDFSFYISVLLIILLFYCILTIMCDLFQRNNQVFKPTSVLVLLQYGLEEAWAGPIIPLQNVPIILFIFSVFWIKLLFNCI